MGIIKPGEPGTWCRPTAPLPEGVSAKVKDAQAGLQAPAEIKAISASSLPTW